MRVATRPFESTSIPDASTQDAARSVPTVSRAEDETAVASGLSPPGCGAPGSVADGHP